jgi:hypothetical protein
VAAVVLTSSQAFPALVEIGFHPTGPGAHQVAVEVFQAGGTVTAAFFVLTALLAWVGRR